MLETRSVAAHLQRLTNLCHLDLRRTELKEIPPQMGNLKNLRKLTGFIVRKHIGPSIEELGMLKHLPGEICITNLQNAMDSKEASEANLKEKNKLRKLELRWQGGTDNSVYDRDMLDGPRPPTEVGRLYIGGYVGTRFPDWLGGTALSKIESLELSNCKYCTSVPPIGKLVVMSSIEGIIQWKGHLTSISHHLPALQELHIGMGKFLERRPPDAEYPCVFPNLKKLYIEECCNFDSLMAPRAITQGFFTSINCLEIFDCSQLVSFPKGRHSAPHLAGHISNSCKNLKWLPERMQSLLPSLVELAIGDSLEIESFPLEGSPFKLEKLLILGCKKLIGCRMNWDLQSLPSLSFINISGRGYEDVESSFPEETLLLSTFTSLLIQNF